MANEITITASITASKSGATVASGSLSKQLDMDGFDVQAQTQCIGADTAGESLEIGGDIDTIGEMVVKHLGIDSTGSSTEYDCYFSYDDAADFDTLQFMTLRPGAFALIQPESTTIFAKAEAGATNGVQIQWWLTDI